MQYSQRSTEKSKLSKTACSVSPVQCSA